MKNHRQLIIMRHAKSAWDTEAESDFDRPLAARGVRDAPRMGRWLKAKRLIPEFVVSSPALRARQTTLSVCDVLDIKNIQWNPRIYGAGTHELLKVLEEVPSDTRSLMMVGHNPGLELLVEFLTGETNFGAIKTATVVCLHVPEIWGSLQRGCASLVVHASPRDLKDE